MNEIIIRCQAQPQHKTEADDGGKPVSSHDNPPPHPTPSYTHTHTPNASPSANDVILTALLSCVNI